MMKLALALALITVCAQSAVSVRTPLRMRLPRGVPETPGNSTLSPFHWTSIEPKPYLEYHPCYYYNFECARLILPLNYNATNPEEQTIALAVIRIPAHVPVTDPRYGGAVLMNPGGPGGSGIASARLYGRPLQSLVDAAYADGSSEYVSNSSTGLYFDIISWDPRGVDNTTPFYSCQRSPAQQIIQYLQGLVPLLGTPEGSFNNIWAQWNALDHGCDYDPQTNPNGPEIVRYMSTSYVVLDMVEILEHHGQWREKQAQTTKQRQRLKYHKGEEPLLYAGGSYGTDVGQMFASMQPHRVQRMFLDGVDNTLDEISGAWVSGLWDADKIMDNMFEYCALAGPEKCDLYAGPTGDDTRKRVLDIIGDMEQNGPVSVPRFGKYDASVVTLSDIFFSAYYMLYYPLFDFRWWAKAMAPLSRRDGRAYVEIYKAGATPIFWSTTYENPSVQINPDDPGSDTHRWASTFQISNAIACSEAWIRKNKTELAGFWKYCQSQSYWGAPLYASEYMSCLPGFPMTEWNYLWDHPVGSNVTANGIIFASNRYDPICPLKSGRISHSRFKGSRLLINDGDGHETFSNPSLELAKIVRRYFQTGELPKADVTFTRPLERPLLGENGPGTAPLPQNATEEERQLARAIYWLPI